LDASADGGIPRDAAPYDFPRSPGVGGFKRPSWRPWRAKSPETAPPPPPASDEVPAAWAAALSLDAEAPADAGGAVRLPGFLGPANGARAKEDLVEASTITAFPS